MKVKLNGEVNSNLDLLIILIKLKSVSKREMGGCQSGNRPWEIQFERRVSGEKLGSYFSPGFGQRGTVKRAIYEAEKELGRPVYSVDVYRAWLKISYFPIRHAGVSIACILDLFRNDEILVDKTYDRYSLNPDLQDSEDNPTGFRVMSD